MGGGLGATSLGSNLNTNIDIKLAKKLLEISWPDFIEVDDLILIKKFVKNYFRNKHSFTDKISAEAFVNHIHILDLFPNKYSKNKSCESGLIFCQMWRNKLHSDFPNYGFRIYYEAIDSPIIRFHKIRVEESNWLNENDYTKEIKNGTIKIFT